jgi:serine/threonine protein kinase
MTGLVGRRVGRYEVEALHRSFATDAIYLAHDPLLGRPVFLKIQHEVSGRAIGGPLLSNEATTLAALRHPGIVPVHDVGTHEGRYYFVFEHLPGGSLAKAFAARTLRPPAVVRVVAEAADAVGYAHRRGFVHRSLGPTTILFDGEGRVRVTGFALAARTADVGGSDLLTFVARTGHAAPEQLARDADRIGPASDVWSLGATLFEGLAGAMPFGADAVHAMIEGRPPSTPCFPEPLPDVTAEQRSACLRCLALDPAERFADASALAEALRATLGRAAGKASRVFVSHSTKDREFVEQEIVGLLERNGVPTWYAKADIDSATEWERTIVKGLESCDWFLLVMSPRSAASEWVRDELSWAFAKRPGKILPVLVEACEAYDFHIRLPRVQHVDFTGDREEARRRLLEALAPA